MNTSGEHKRNLILITVDCLRRDVFYELLEAGELEGLGHFRRDFVEFGGFFANGPNTYHAMPSIFASRYSVTNGPRICDYEKTLPCFLQEAGYTTIGINQANPLCSSIRLFNRGFDLFLDFLGYAAKPHILEVKGSTARSLAKCLLKRMFGKRWGGLRRSANLLHHRYYRRYFDNPRKHNDLYDRMIELHRKFTSSLRLIAEELRHVQPFFLWIHIMDTHSPYVSGIGAEREKVIELNSRLIYSRRYRRDALSLYKASIVDTDRRIGCLLRMLEEHGIYGDTEIVITSDHGEELYDHGQFGHTHYQCYDEVLHVPLLIKSEKNVGLSAHRDALLSQIDLLPTALGIMDLLEGIDYAFAGENLSDIGCRDRDYAISTSFDIGMGDVREAETGEICKVVRTKRHKLKLCEEQSIYELYDIIDDPQETRNIYKTEKRIVGELRELFSREIERSRRIDVHNRLVSRIDIARDSLRCRSSEYA